MRNVYLILIALLLIFLAPAAMYTLDQTEQAIITQFGEPIGGAVTEAGLHLKMPFIHTVRRFDKRWLAWDGNANEITTKDKKFIWVDTYARWRIADPLKFLQELQNETRARSRLADIIDGETRNAVARFALIEIVRSTNRDFETTEVLEELMNEEAQVEIESGRDVIRSVILEKTAAVMPGFGIELVDVRFKRIDYVEDVRADVYERMISERNRIAERSRSEGQGRAAEIRGQRERDLLTISSEAFKVAEETRGKADAEATGIYARAYGKDPDFYQFMKTLETYRSSLDEDVTVLLSSNSEFLKFLKRSR